MVDENKMFSFNEKIIESKKVFPSSNKLIDQVINLINKSQEKLKQSKDVINDFDFVSNQFTDFKEFIQILSLIHI